MKSIRNSKKLIKQAGFTLLEICIAIMILGYAMIIVARLFGSVTMSAKASEFETLASNFARAKMEDLINREYDSLPEGAWTPDVWTVDASQALAQKGILNFTREVKISYIKNVGGVLTISATDEGLKQVNIKVAWNERGKVREIDYTSLVARGV
ncbi:MAG: type II secretion system protein [bacterium]|nr:type II secretion system protein [bacterium]